MGLVAGMIPSDYVVHEVAAVMNFFLIILLLLVVVVVSVIMFRRSKRWAAARQDERITSAETRLRDAEHVANAAAASATRLRRDMEDSQSGLLEEIRHVGARVEDVLADRATLTDVDSRTLSLEQMYQGLNASVAALSAQVSRLACSEERWHEGEMPPICPVSKIACPLVQNPFASPSPEEKKDDE